MQLYMMALAEALVEAWQTAKEQHGRVPAGVKLQSNEIKALRGWNVEDVGPVLKTAPDGYMRLLGMEVITVIVAPLDAAERFVWETQPA